MDSVDQTIRMNNLSKELRKYGFAESSQDAVAQASAIYGNGSEELNAEVELMQLTRSQFNEIINKMQRLWMFKNTTDQKIDAIADQVVKVTEKLNELIKSISMIEMNQAVFDRKIGVLKDNIHDSFIESSKQVKEPPKHAKKDEEHVEKSSEKEVQEKLENPIDRNGVAPADVSIDKIFYCGKKR